jgi:hypothetical protein
MSGFKLQRLGLLMAPEPGNSLEVEGVLNPAAVRGPDRQLYLFPRHASFRAYHGIEFDGVDNKDASVFPLAIPDPYGQPALAMLHRPLFPGTRPEETACHPTSRAVDLHKESIWISYCSTGIEDCEPHHLCHFGSHHRLASPVAPWEPDPARLADYLSWRRRNHRTYQRRAKTALLGWGDGALKRISARNLLSFAKTDADTGPAARAPKDCSKRRISHGHGPARRSQLTEPLRHLLWVADDRSGVARLDVLDFLPTEGLADPPVARVSGADKLVIKPLTLKPFQPSLVSLVSCAPFTTGTLFEMAGIEKRCRHRQHVERTTKWRHRRAVITSPVAIARSNCRLNMIIGRE